MSVSQSRRDVASLAAAVGMLSALTWAFRYAWHYGNPTTIALALLLVVLIVATTSRIWAAMTVAVLADLCLNYFFMPPFGTFAIADPENWAALGAFLVVSLVSSSLSGAARDRAVARRSGELKSALLSSLGHNLRTPLTSMRVAAENLQAAGLSEHDRREQAGLIRMEVDRLHHLFEHVLAMARLDAGAVTPQTAWVDAEAVLEAARDQAGPALDGRDVVFHTDSDDQVRLDPRLTASALGHVLENAAQYSPDYQPIDVTFSLTDRTFVARVRDRGPGIDAVDALHVFEPFYRGATGSGRSGGTGMGLAIARGLLTVEGGRISAQTAHEGGTVFTIEVPVSGRRALPDRSA